MAKGEQIAAEEPQTNDLAALTSIWRSVAPLTDEDSMKTGRQVLAKIRRLTQKSNCDAVHPKEPMVEMDVPMPLGVGGADAFTIANARTTLRFRGHVIVPQCVAQTLAEMIAKNRQVDAARLQNNGQIVDLDNPIASRARAIQQA